MFFGLAAVSRSRMRMEKMELSGSDGRMEINWSPLKRRLRAARALLLRYWQAKSCLLCMQGMTGAQAICDDCKVDLPWLLHACRHCALPLPAGESCCRQCEYSRQPFTKASAVWSYEFPVSTLISRFKYQARWPYGRLLAQMLAEHLQHVFQEQLLSRPDCLLAVPLASKRQRKRGFNQARMLAGWLGKELGLQVLDRAVLRVRHTPMQQGLAAGDRRRNMRNAFRVDRVELVAGRHIAIVDDVVTTGATCAELARCLLAAGAVRVDVYALARTGRPGAAEPDEHP